MQTQTQQVINLVSAAKTVLEQVQSGEIFSHDVKHIERNVSAMDALESALDIVRTDLFPPRDLSTNLYFRSTSIILNDTQSRLERLNNSLPGIMQAEALAELLTAKGVKTIASYASDHGPYLITHVPIEELPIVSKVVQNVADETQRQVVGKYDWYTLLPKDIYDKNIKSIAYRPVWVGYDPSHTGDIAALIVMAPLLIVKEV